MKQRVSVVFLVSVVAIAEGRKPSLGNEKLDQNPSTSMPATSTPSGKEQGSRYLFNRPFHPLRKTNHPVRHGIQSATVDASVVADSMGEGGFVIAPNSDIIVTGGAENPDVKPDFQSFKGEKRGVKSQTGQDHFSHHERKTINPGSDQHLFRARIPQTNQSFIKPLSYQSAPVSIIQTHGSVPESLMTQNSPSKSPPAQEFFRSDALPLSYMPPGLPINQNPRWYMPQTVSNGMVPPGSMLTHNLGSPSMHYDYDMIYGQVPTDPTYLSAVSPYIPPQMVPGFGPEQLELQAGGNGFEAREGWGFQSGEAGFQAGAGGFGFQPGFQTGPGNLGFQAGMSPYGPGLGVYQPGAASYLAGRMADNEPSHVSTADRNTQETGIPNHPGGTGQELDSPIGSKPPVSMSGRQLTNPKMPTITVSNHMSEAPTAMKGYAALLELALNREGGTTNYKNIGNITKSTDQADRNRLFPRILKFSATISGRPVHCTLNLTGPRQLTALFKNQPHVHCDSDPQPSSRSGKKNSPKNEAFRLQQKNNGGHKRNGVHGRSPIPRKT